MSSWGTQLQLVLWKHVYIIRIRRHFVTTLLEVVFMVLLLNGVWEESVAPYSGAPSKEQFYDVSDPMQPWRSKNFSAGLFAFTPPTGIARNISEKAAPLLGAWSLVPFDNESELSHFVGNASSPEDRVGVMFSQDGDSLSYTVRFRNASFDIALHYDDDLVFPGPRSVESSDEISRLLPVQYAVESSFLDLMKKGGDDSTDGDKPLELQRFPYPKIFEGAETATLSKIVIRFAIGGFVPFCIVVMKLVAEKCKGMKDMLLRTGMIDAVYWTGHFSEAAIVISTAIALMYGPLFVLPNTSGTAFLQYTSPAIVICIITLFGILTILHGMFLSIFIWRDDISFVASVMYWCFIGAVPYIYLQNVFGNGYYLVTDREKLLSSVSPLMYLHWCFRVMERYEKYSVPLTWSEIYETDTTLDNVCLGSLTLVALATTAALVFLIWYLDNVVPWNSGVPKPFYFLLSFDYWSPSRKWNIRKNPPNLDPTRFEPDPKNGDPTVHLVNISRAATNTASPVCNVDLTIYKKQTTILLGPEGCGNETVINIITGNDVPTSGEVYINNFDVLINPRKTWEFLSYCPRRNVVFDDMTVEEHLLYFISLRGESWKNAHEEAMSVLRQLDLFNFKDDLVGDLTVRMQRSLCVAIAICLMEKVPLLILEEPTRSMDPKCRHEVWEMIVKASNKSSVLVTTNNMAEAETLADRVIMMHEGKVVCAGSPSWLVDRFGSRYHLHFTKQVNFRASNVEATIQRYVGVATKLWETKFEVEYNIGPVRWPARMASLFRSLDEYRTYFGIIFMSVTVTSLEDIYLRIASGADPKKEGAGDAPEDIAKNEARYLEILRTLASFKAGSVDTLDMLAGLLTKRFTIWKRVWSTRTLRLWLPLGIFLLTGISKRTLFGRRYDYEESLTYRVKNIFKGKSYAFVVADHSQGKFVKDVLKPLLEEEGVRLLHVDDLFIEKGLLAIAQNDIYSYVYRDHYGVTLLGNRVRLWYNAQCPHTALLIVNMYHTALLRNATKANDAWITLTNYPYREPQDHEQARFITEHGKIVSDRQDNLFVTRNVLLRVLHSFVISLAMCFHSATFVFLPIWERVNGLKHLQLMTGMSACVYWTSNFIFDGIVALTQNIVFTAALWWSHPYITAPYIGSIYVIFCAYTVATLPLTYLCSFLFNSTARAFSFMALLLFLAGMVGSLAVETFGLLLRHTSSYAASVLLITWGFVCRWFPTYSLTRGIIKVILLYKYNDVCLTGGAVLMEACRDRYISRDERIALCCRAMSDNSMTATLMSPLEMSYETGFFEVATMLVEGFLYMALLTVIDSPIMNGIIRLWNRRTEEKRGEQDKGPRLVVVSMDPDVEKEHKLVEEIYKTHVFNNAAMAMRNLEKWTGLFEQMKVVGSLSFTLRQNECLGLIGVNSSGKTTIMKILTGQLVPTVGNAYMPKLSLKGDLKQWQASIGYAPESNPLIPYMTGREMVDMFARFKGIPDRSNVVASVFKFASVKKQNQLCSSYSAGDQRILTIVIAVLGVPPILLLDEPISDVDPVSRLEIIHMLEVLKSSRTMSIIISSHGMKHCEILCDRVALLVSGKIEALGSGRQLNQKYGGCYTITIKTLPSRRNDAYHRNRIIKTMKEEFHQCVVSFIYKSVLCFTVGKTYTDWNEIFPKMMYIQQKLEFKDFLISDMTLQHIFVGLARKQILVTGNRPYVSSPNSPY